MELTSVALPLVSFRHTFQFLETGDALTSESTSRFRDRHEVISTIVANNFTVADIRDAPDRPGRELVFLARASG